MGLGIHMMCEHRGATSRTHLSAPCLLSCALSPWANVQWHRPMGKSAKDLQKHVVSLPPCRINTQQRLLPALYVHALDFFLIKLRTTSQGWPHPQWVGSAKSAIRQENALQPCNVVGCFLDWSLFSEDSSFCQADEKLVSAALKTVLFFIYVCVCGVMHVYVYVWVCA